MAKPPIKLLLSGGRGRMGRAIQEVISDDAGRTIELAGVLSRSSSNEHQSLNCPVHTCVTDASFDCLIDFSLPGSSLAWARECAALHKPLVVGTTGFSDQQLNELKELSEDCPLLLSANMSLGVNLSFYLLREMTRSMGHLADIDIIETHHRHKLDAPSGTALAMGQVIAHELGHNLDEIAYTHSPKGRERSNPSIGFSSSRVGDVVGDHTVVYALQGERLELTHKATSRMTFARGAVFAAQWLVNQSPGFYDMQDALNLR